MNFRRKNFCPVDRNNNLSITNTLSSIFETQNFIIDYYYDIKNIHYSLLNLINVIQHKASEKLMI